MGESINISEYIDIFRKRKNIILVIVIIFMAAGKYLQYRHDQAYVPTYTSTVSVRVNVNKPTKTTTKSSSSKKSSKSTTTENNSSTTYGASLESSALNQSIAEKYSQVALSKRAMMDLIDRLELQTTPESISSMISITPQESLMEFIDIRVTNTNAELAQKIANEMPEVFNEELKKVIGLDCVEVLYDATEPMVNARAQDNTFRNFAVVGIALSIFVVLLLECLDNKVVTPEDAEKYWGLPVIGVVPFEKANVKGKKAVEVEVE